MQARVAITGMGIVTPIGAGVAAFHAALFAGRSGIGPITRFDTGKLLYHRGGEIAPLPGLPAGIDADTPPDPALCFTAVAVDEAVRDAGLNSIADRGRIGIVLSTNFGCASVFERVLAADPGCTLAGYSFQHVADALALASAFDGPRAVLSLSCASGAAALGWGADLVRNGRATAVVTGGFDALSLFAWSGLSALRTMTRDCVRPFDAGRSGTIFSEGAAVLVVEDLAHALDRGAPVYAEVLGYAANNNAHHLTAPPGRGAGSAAVMRAALAAAGVQAQAIDHINAHGTGTKHNDVTETQAIKDVLGQRAYEVPVTSIKGSTGHLMGAAGSAEAIATVLALRTGIIPPTMNFENADPECDLDYVFNRKRCHAVRTALSHSAGIGGCNAAVVLRAFEEGARHA